MRFLWRGVLFILFFASVQGRFSDILDGDLVEFIQNDYYGALGLPSSASEKEVKKAYRKLSMQYHPDRNPTADKQRFLDITAANQVLSNPERKNKYDLFLKECPKAWLPVYGKWKANPLSVLIGALVGVVTLVTLAQGQQFKRERNRALGSEFYNKALEKAVSEGQSEEEFYEMFVSANPEIERTWKDTLGFRLVTFPLQLIGLVSSPNANKKSIQQRSHELQEQGEEGGFDEDGYDEDGDEEYESEDDLDTESAYRGPKLDENASEAEIKQAAKQRRKAERRRLEKAKKAKEEKLKAKERSRKAAELEALRKEQQAKAEEQRLRFEKMESERVQKEKNERRKARIQNEVNSDVVLRLIENDESGELWEFLEGQGVLPQADELEEELVDPVLPNIKASLLELLDSGEFGEESFWQDVFDASFREYDKDRQREAERLQEEYEEQQRQKLREVQEKGESFSAQEEESQVVDEAWLAELEAEKQAKKQKAKEKRQEKQSAKAPAASKSAHRGKKERRR